MFSSDGALPYSNRRLQWGMLPMPIFPPTSLCGTFARDDDVRFICGSDAHGVECLIAARDANQVVEAITSVNRVQQADHFRVLGIDSFLYGGPTVSP